MSTEGKLFKEFGLKYRDGIVDEGKWEEINPKILFILKETNDFECDLRSFLKDGGRPKTWSNIARWSYLIKKMFKKNNDTPDFKDFLKKGNDCGRKKHLSTACVMNLKKTAGQSTTKPNEFRDYFKDPKTIDILKEQMKLYPKIDIIICCGDIVFEIFKNKVLEDKELEKITDDFKLEHKNRCRKLRLYKSSKGYYVINFIHPQQHTYTNEKVWKSLGNIVKEINKNHLAEFATRE